MGKDRELVSLAIEERTFGNTLRAMRELHGLSLKDVARDARVSRSHLSEVENGRHPPPSLPWLTRVLAAMELPPDDCADLLQLAEGEIVEVAIDRWSKGRGGDVDSE